MKKYSNYKSNYDKYPVVQVSETSENVCWRGWPEIVSQLNKSLGNVHKPVKVLVVECYQGVYDEEVKSALKGQLPHTLWLDASSAMKTSEEINSFLKSDITDDEIFGYMTRYHMDCYFDEKKIAELHEKVGGVSAGVVIVYGVGAAYEMPESDVLVYADMARWEIQMRFRRNEISNVGVDNRMERASLQYKRGFFVDWRICDRFKKTLMNKWDYVLDTNVMGDPKMATAAIVDAGLKKASKSPFRVVPFFDPGPWGGQWMKEICDLDRVTPNFAWCFDCVPEENSLYLGFGEVRFEIPSIDLVFSYPRELLGNPVYGRFGDEFPIRFDFLDTMDGGNLSLQVHPLTQYIQEKFGMHYTQDESYYILDAEEDASVYLGVKEGIVPEEMINALTEAQHTGHFEAEKYVGNYPVKKHDHVLIPAGTVHCSGRNSMVLEISATPYIFTFKLWDWGRLGLDGRPRPINIGHGKHVIQWNRTEPWVRREIYNKIDKVAEGDGWIEEHTGLHECEFIETRRHWFTKPVLHKTDGSVNVLKDSINKHFWNEDKGLYECYLYPEISGYKASERVGVMSNGLCAVLGASTDEQIRRMVGNFPLYPYGAAVLYPSIPDDFAYHNKSVWPVWQTPYMYAARQVGNISAVEHMATSLTRASALFLTHKENMTYDTGYDRGTALNSDRQLWSVSSYISLVYRVLFGMNLTERGIAFNPVVPDMVNGWLSLSDFRYRDATIDIKVSGKGNWLKSLKVNGEKQALPFVLPADSKGEYSIEIEMMIDEPKGKINLVKAGPGKCWSPVEPVLVLNGSTLSWKEEENMKYYLHSNFSEEDKLVTSPYDLIGAPDGFYSVYAVDEKGFASDMSNAVVYSTWQSVCEAEQSSHSGTVCNLHKGFSGSGFVIDLFARPANVKFQVQVPEAGDYAIALRGANGHGPHGTWCAIRSVAVDGNDAGTFILEATGDWKQWLDSNYIVLRGLNAGEHTVSLSIDPERKGYDFNMSHGREDANDCHIDCLKLIRL